MTNDTLPLVRAIELRREFTLRGQRVPAVDSVSLDLAAGSLVLIRGKSGSGKTTLLNLMGGLDRPTAGSVSYRGRDLAWLSEREMTHWRRTEVAFIFQAFALLPGLTAAENVDVPLRIAGSDARTAAARAAECLETVGLAARAHHRTFELSGGEQQRVAVARALVKGPALLLADEPTGELDQAAGHHVLGILRRLVKERGLAVCVTSHDSSAAEYADIVYTMRDGRLSELESAA